MKFFFEINGRVLENLASNCPIEHTIELLQNKYKNLNMGGPISSAFTNVLANLSHTITIFYIVSTLIKDSLQDYLARDYDCSLRCYNTGFYCEVCKFLIKRR
jgi:hypothetical protein